jgi:hypothetical protein
MRAGKKKQSEWEASSSFCEAPRVLLGDGKAVEKEIE